MNIVEQLAEAREQIKTLTAQNTEAATRATTAETALATEKANHVKTQGSLTAEQSAHAATTEKLGKAETDLTAAKAELKTANEKIAAFDATVEEKASAKAAQIVAAAGGTPIQSAGKDKPAGQETKTDLKGLAKVQAAFKAQLSK